MIYHMPVLAILSCLLLATAAGAAEPADFQERIHRAQSAILPQVVYVHVVGEDYEGGEAKRALWSGSGVIISSDGYIATNHHVLYRAQRVRVMLSDRRAFEAEIVGSDEETDLGLLRLKLPPGSPALPFASFAEGRNLSAGEFVLAVGSPFGLASSVSFGIVNNPAQSLGDDGLYNWIQTDAAINHGNSGGPLVDLEGRIVGIDTLGIGGSGIGFAIPAQQAREVLTRIQAAGRVERSTLGLTLQALRDFGRESYAPGERGVLIGGVEPDSPGARAGLAPGDILLSAGGRPLDALYASDLPAVRRLLVDLPAGRPVRLETLREGRTVPLTAVPKRHAGPADAVFDAPEWMLTAQEIGEEDDTVIHFFRPRGAWILGVSPDGNAARSGLEPYDILLEVDGREVLSLEDLRQAYRRSLERGPAKRLLLVSVLRRGRPLKLALDYSRSRSAREEER